LAKTYNTLTIEVKEDITDIITAKQDDTQSRYLDVILQDDGQPINLTGQEVRIYGRKKDKTEFFNDGTITDAAKGRCQFELTNQALAVVGDVEVEISIWQNNQRILTTQTFKVFVVPKIRNDTAIESSNEFGALVVLFQKLYDFWLDIEKTLGKPNDIGGTETTGTVMAKLNALFKASGASSLKVKSVQHGFIFAGSTKTESRLLAIATVNVAKSILITDTGGIGLQIGSARYVAPQLIDSNHLKQYPHSYDRDSNTNTYTYYFPASNWSIVEFY
jgi:hypothetical protein